MSVPYRDPGFPLFTACLVLVFILFLQATRLDGAVAERDQLRAQLDEVAEILKHAGGSTAGYWQVQDARRVLAGEEPHPFTTCRRDPPQGGCEHLRPPSGWWSAGPARGEDYP
jgi:hypothetical protein